ncbi:MAG: zincin-like metallopeptidase domain-containing protein [Gemmatimonadota bacterium]|nr:zincin-like metallopeptidase domain-containing protein [Deltaproteobacteria bacterium]MDE2973699.1 zincin-like metallopeptidase domain-containing protein [Gemmatimonadota bacterium]
MARFWRKKSKPVAERVQEHHKEFAARIIKQIKEGVAPWQKPWKPGERFLPANFKTGNAYRGTNTLNLASVAIERGYSDHRWGTYKQIKAAGGYVRSGEKGARIIYFETHRRQPAKDEDGKPVKDKDGKQVYERVPREKPFPKPYVVFNVEQAERLNLPELPDAKPGWKAHGDAERVIRASGVDFRHERGDRAFYRPGKDQIVMPPPEQFGDEGRYYRTALHEVAHATGHEKRMDRQSLHDAVNAGVGSQSYAREELRAEISSMMTNTELGIGHNSRHGAAYVESWVQVLEEQPKEIGAAARDAQTMSTYMLERGREMGERNKAQAKASGSASREPELQHRKTGAERFEYRGDDRTATITRPAAQDGTTEHDRRHTEQRHYLVTMEDRGGVGKLTAWAKDLDDAHEKARRFTATGVAPTWSEHHGHTGSPRHSPAAPAAGPIPERTASPDRDDGPER